MHFIIQVLFLVIIASNCYECLSEVSDSNDNDTYNWPTVVISVLVRNQAHTLPYFLSCILGLDYPKDRLYIWIYTDFNEDNSDAVLQFLSKHYGAIFRGVYVISTSDGPLYGDEDNFSHWTPKHYKHVINLREHGLDFARKMWADYMFMLDADVYLTNPATLNILVKKKLDVVAPMLVSDGLFSNFWCGMTESYYYKRTDEYKEILNQEKIGCFSVPMVHTAVLVYLRSTASDVITYKPSRARKYDGPMDDIITFAVNARNNDIKLHICNDNFYGYLQVPLEDGDDMTDDKEQLLNIKMEAIGRGKPIPLDIAMERFVDFPKPSKLEIDEIYMINLERRSHRRELMEMSFKELGMDVTLFNAYDGRRLDAPELHNILKVMPHYEDPYHKRPMKMGEVGCFLSHYAIWTEIVQRGRAITMVLEDDIRFVPYFRSRLNNLLREIRELRWDIVYLGRKALRDEEEEYVAPHVTKPLYSYWTLGYLITDFGAAKLLDAKPLTKLLPVDEFLPIMFDQHPNTTWKSYFRDRNLRAFSAAPLLVYPTHYTGQKGYVSDTEDSDIFEMNVNKRSEL